MRARRVLGETEPKALDHLVKQTPVEAKKIPQTNRNIFVLFSPWLVLIFQLC